MESCVNEQKTNVPELLTISEAANIFKKSKKFLSTPLGLRTFTHQAIFDAIFVAIYTAIFVAPALQVQIALVNRQQLQCNIISNLVRILAQNTSELVLNITSLDLIKF